MSLSGTDSIGQELLQAVAADEMILPTLPEIALQVRDAAEDPQISIPELARVISRDIAIPARLVRVANSPLLRTGHEVRDLQAAISRLGLNMSCSLTIGLAMEQLFQAGSGLIDRRMREVWNHSTRIAAISHVLCRCHTRLPPDQALLAGLLHQIGMLPLLTWADENPALQADSLVLEQLLQALHPGLGQKILEHWRFPACLACVPAGYLNLQRQSTAVDYTDIVQAATLYGGLSDSPDRLPEWSTVPALQQLGIMAGSLHRNDARFAAILEEADQLLLV